MATQNLVQLESRLPLNQHLIKISINGWQFYGIASTEDAVVDNGNGRKVRGIVEISNITEWDDSDHFLLGEGEDLDAYTLSAIKAMVIHNLNETDSAFGDWTDSGRSLVYHLHNQRKYFLDLNQEETLKVA